MNVTQTLGSRFLGVRGKVVLRGASCSRDVTLKAVQADAAIQPPVLGLRASACALPHPEKLATGGEDAYFISADATVMGVADGVSGWRESGVDPGDYSRTLMRVACEFFNSGQANELNCSAEEKARAALASAHQKTRVPGTSTACILTLDAEHSAIAAANLGDSGFVVIRNGTVVFQTPSQMHYFDCPYQLGAAPEFVEDTNYPSDAETYRFNVMAGDIIVMATDGLWDNCELEEIAQLIPDTDEAVDTAAELLASAARERADDPELESPYVKAAKAEGLDLPWWEKISGAKFENGRFALKELLGGKLDDITVLVARVTDAPPVVEEIADTEGALEEASEDASAKASEEASEKASEDASEQASETSSEKSSKAPEAKSGAE